MLILTFYKTSKVEERKREREREREKERERDVMCSEAFCLGALHLYIIETGMWSKST